MERIPRPDVPAVVTDEPTEEAITVEVRGAGGDGLVSLPGGATVEGDGHVPPVARPGRVVPVGDTDPAVRVVHRQPVEELVAGARGANDNRGTPARPTVRRGADPALHLATCVVVVGHIQVHSRVHVDDRDVADPLTAPG